MSICSAHCRSMSVSHFVSAPTGASSITHYLGQAPPVSQNSPQHQPGGQQQGAGQSQGQQGWSQSQVQHSGQRPGRGRAQGKPQVPVWFRPTPSPSQQATQGASSSAAPQPRASKQPAQPTGRGPVEIVDLEPDLKTEEADLSPLGSSPSGSPLGSPRQQSTFQWSDAGTGAEEEHQWAGSPMRLMQPTQLMQLPQPMQPVDDIHIEHAPQLQLTPSLLGKQEQALSQPSHGGSQPPASLNAWLQVPQLSSSQASLIQGSWHSQQPKAMEGGEHGSDPQAVLVAQRTQQQVQVRCRNRTERLHCEARYWARIKIRF